MAWFVAIFGINTTKLWYLLLYVISRAVRRVKLETIFKYLEWYLCQISRTNHYNCETFTRLQDFFFHFPERFLVRSFTIIFLFHTSLCYSYLQHLIRMRTFCCIILWVVTNNQPAETMNTNNWVIYPCITLILVNVYWKTLADNRNTDWALKKAKVLLQVRSYYPQNKNS